MAESPLTPRPISTKLTNSAESRRQAEACRKSAEIATLGNVRQQLLAAAARWEELAAQAERVDDARSAKLAEVTPARG